MNEQEVIERLSKLLELRKSKTTGKIKYDSCICGTEDLETVLNLLKGKDAEIQQSSAENAELKETNAEHQKINGELQEKLTKAEKMIDLMAEYLSSIDFFDMCDEIPEPCMGCDASEDIDRHIKCIKQYFKEKVESEEAI